MPIALLSTGLLGLEVVVGTVCDSTTNKDDSVETDAKAAGGRRGRGRGGGGSVGLGLGVTGL